MRLAQNESALKKVTQLIEYAFNKTNSLQQDPLFLARYQHATCYGQENAGELTSVVMANHFTAQFYQQQLATAGIGYVASLPEVRGSGGIARTMNELLADLAEKKVALSLLAPFSENFYRQFGYENVIGQKQYHLDRLAFNDFKSETAGQIKRGTWQNDSLRQIVLGLYHKKLAAGKEVATIAREAWWWQRSDDYYPHRFIAVAYDEAENACGYLIYRMRGDTFIVDELVYQTIFGLRKLLTFMKSHVSSFQHFTYAAPLTEILETCFLETAAITIELRPYMMGRIVDFKTVVESLPLESGEYYFEVTSDAQCPQNIGVWKVTVAKQVQCQKVNDRLAELAGDIRSWTQLLLGGESLEQLLFLNAMQSSQSAKEKVLFPKGKHSFYDYF